MWKLVVTVVAILVLGTLLAGEAVAGEPLGFWPEVNLLPSSATQQFESTWVAVGSEIPTRAYEDFSLWICLADIMGSSTANPRFRFRGRRVSGGTLYYLPIKATGTSDIKLEDQYFEFNEDVNQCMVIDIWLNNILPYMLLEISAGTVGSASSYISSAYIIRGDR